MAPLITVAIDGWFRAMLSCRSFMPALLLSIWFHALTLLILSSTENIPWNNGLFGLGDAAYSSRQKALRVVTLAENDVAGPDVGPAPLSVPLPAPQAGGSHDANNTDSQGSPLPAQRYYRVNELDIKPQIRVSVDPEFPLTVNPGTRGTVVLLLFLDQEGQVEAVKSIRSTPPGIFDEAAIQAFRQARYTPGIREGKPVNVQLAIEVEFESSSLK